MTTNKMKILIESFKSFITENELQVKKGAWSVNIQDSEGNEYQLADITQGLLDAGYEFENEDIKNALINDDNPIEVFERYAVDMEEITKAFADSRGWGHNFQHVEDD